MPILPFDGRDGHARLDPASRPSHGQAALLLVESLIHGLIARSVLSVAEAIEIIETAADVELELANSARDGGVDFSEPPCPSLLSPLAASLARDLGG